jgi:DNA invertase Pin-like site-specific DNA recombinase
MPKARPSLRPSPIPGPTTSSASYQLELARRQKERRDKILQLNQIHISNAEIARKLGIGLKTVRRDLRNLQDNPTGIRIVDSYQRRQQGKWWKAIEGILKELPSFSSMGIKPSLRTMF